MHTQGFAGRAAATMGLPGLHQSAVSEARAGPFLAGPFLAGPLLAGPQPARRL